MSDPLQFVPFSVVAILICLAALPVTASRMVQPELPPTPRLALVAQYRAAPAAASGALLSGLAMGAFWGLTPLYAVRLGLRSEEHTSELQSLMRISYAVFCLKKKNDN